MIRFEQILPTVMIVLSVLSAAGYLAYGNGTVGEDFRKVTYWLSAALITWSVTF